MNDNKLKINNSYDSEPSSGSGSLLGESDHYENVSFNESITKLSVILQPKYQRMDISENIQQIDEICPKDSTIKNVVLKINECAVHSSQESEFEGYAANDIDPTNTYSKRNDVHETEDNTNVNDTSILNDSKRSDLCETSPIIDNISTEIHNEKYHICPIEMEKTIPTEFIGSSTSEENSCNAVDMKLSNESPKYSNNANDLSFNGKIKQLFAINKNQNITTNDGNINNLENEDSNTFMYTNERSPDLFEDDEYNDAGEEVTEESTRTKHNAFTISDQIGDTSFEDISMLSNVRKREKEILRRVQTSLSGVPPPPSVTIMQMDMFSKVSECKDKILNFCNTPIKNVSTGNGCDKEVLFKPTHNIEEIQNMGWPNVLNVNHYGLSYNLSETSEKIESLGMSVAERYIGAETSSSFMNNFSPSSAKKRISRLKMLIKSPGSRLSHLAKRRAIFSSANLQVTLQKPAVATVTNRQILLDSTKSQCHRKMKLGTPKRRTPGRRKTSVRKTPTSSARKKLLLAHPPKPGPSRETSKRALFQSPPKEKIIIPKIAINPEIANRVEKSKRALFSPVKAYSANSQDSSNLSSIHYEPLTINDSSLASEISIKRKRCEDYVIGNSQKLYKTDSNDTNFNMENLTPRSLKIKSQSFCIGAGSRKPLPDVSGKSLIRASSDTTFYSSQLTESHKKKLLWAVSQALQSKQIGVKHGSFKQYASVLARIVKRLFLEISDKSGSTSDKMLRLAKKYVFWVLQGKTADEIYISEKNRLNHEKHLHTKITGYITPEDYENRKNILKKSTSDLLFSENSVDSFNISQSLVEYTPSSGFISQENIIHSQDVCIRQPIQINTTLNNSSSKNNLHGIALRENVDIEQRRSGQKNFTGKDQKNISPYTEKSRSNLKKFPSSIFDVNAMKAKRQISFDN